MSEQLSSSSTPVKLLVTGQGYVGPPISMRAIQVVELMLGVGCEVQVADPHVITTHFDSGVTHVEVSPGDLDAADAVVLLVNHDPFDNDAIAATTTFILHTRHRMSGATVAYL